jgi:protein SCO1/2
MRVLLKHLALLACPALAFGAAAAHARQQALPAKVFSEVGIDQHLNELLPLELTFRDEEGRIVPLDRYFHSKPVIISLVYYRCPMLCTQVLNGMVETFNIISLTAGNQFDVVTLSIDPAETSELAAKKKAEYISTYKREGVQNGWHFLTGDSTSIAKVAGALGFKFVYDEETKLFAHASGIMIATPEGRIARYLYGIEYPAKDLTFSLMEASKEKIGSPVEKLQLLCYAYDPKAGKYSLVIANVFRAAGVVTILLLGGFMYVNFRRDRRNRQEVAKSEVSGH